MGANDFTMRPARDLLHQLPLLPTRPDCSVDFEAADAALLLAVAENGETVMNAFQLGLSALGVILAHASPEVGSEIGSDTIIGNFVSFHSENHNFEDPLQPIRLQGVKLPGVGEVPVQLIQAMPYLLTLFLLAGFIGRTVAPKAAGVPYEKEH